MRAWKKSKLMRKFFQRSNLMIAVSYIMKRKIKKIFFEVISNSKIFNIIFFNEIVNDQDFPNLQGARQRGGDLDSVEYGNKVLHSLQLLIVNWFKFHNLFINSLRLVSYNNINHLKLCTITIKFTNCDNWNVPITILKYITYFIVSS